MSLLTIFRPTPQRPPGRHTAEWAALQQRARSAEQEREAMRAERDAAQDETEQLRQRQHRMETGYSHALKTMGAESMAIAEELEQVKAERNAATREVRRLNAILDASDGRPCLHVDAPIEQGCRDTPQAAEATVQATLADLEQEGDKPLLDLLSGLKAAKPSSGPKPPMPGEITAATDVRTLWDRSIPVATPVSAITGERARESVADAVNA